MFSYHPGHRLQVRTLNHPDEMEIVYRLTHDNYVRRGIAHFRQSRKIIHHCPQSDDPRTTVFLAYLNEQIVGTLSVSLVDQIEDLYNYEVFEQDLIFENTEVAGAKLFSGWRLATSHAGPHSLIISLQLLFHAMKWIIKQKVEYGYLCFQKEDLSFYERFCPKGKIIGYRRKQNESIDTELYMWRCHISPVDYRNTQRLLTRLSQGFGA